MKRRFKAEGSPPHLPHKKIPSIRAESPQLETSAESSNDLGERLMNLPFELKQKILFSFTPKERRRLRLVNKAMLDAVDASMSDVQEIDIEFEKRYEAYVVITTINPYNGTAKRHLHKIVPYSSFPFLLKWAGAQLKTVKLAIDPFISGEEYFCFVALCRLLEELTSENTCPKLKNLSLDLRDSLWDDNEILLSGLLKYLTKRQFQAKASDHPTPFLHSLSLISSPDPGGSETSEIERTHGEYMRKFLQDILDQCDGLKELKMDRLIWMKDLPIEALRYPTTLTQLESERMDKDSDALQAIVSNCPNLQKVDLCTDFPRDDAKLQALASLCDLRELELKVCVTEEKIVLLTEQCLAAFEDHPFGVSIARPWPQLRSVTLNCFTEEDYEFPKYRLLLSCANYCITSLHVMWCPRWFGECYAPPVERLFKALNKEDAYPNLMELNINTCKLVDSIADSLTTAKDRQEKGPERWGCKFGTVPFPQPHVYAIFNDVLAFVTKRQSEVRLGKPFLRSLSIGKDSRSCFACRLGQGDLRVLSDQLEQIYSSVQQILDQCHGLEELYMDSLNDEEINPDKKKGRELIKLVPLRFPTTLKKLNGVWLN